MNSKTKTAIPHPVPRHAADVYDNLVFWARHFSACPAKIMWIENKKLALVLLPRNNVLKEAALRVAKSFSVPCYGVPNPDRVSLFQCMDDMGVPAMVYVEWECE